MMLKRLRARIRNRRFSDDLAEELRFHEEMKRQELETAGLSPDQARSAARRALGNATLMREESRRIWIAPWIESVLQDVRHAFRTLLRQPLHSATAIIVLVFAIGLNASLFTLFKALAMEPWPVSDPGSVVKIWARANNHPVGPSVDEFRFMRDHARSFAGLAAHTGTYPAEIRAQNLAPVSLRASWTSANFFDLLGVRTAAGARLLPG